MFWRSLSTNWQNIKDQHVEFFPNGLVVLVCFVLAVVATGYLWGLILSELSKRRIHSREAVRVQLASWLLKYIPGQTGSFVYKVTWAGKEEISKNNVITSFLYENLFLTIASTIPTIPILIIALGDRSKYNLPLIFAILVVLPIIISRRYFMKKMEQLVKKVSKTDIKLTYFSFKRIVYYSFLFLLPRVINGLGFIILADSFLEVNPGMYLVLGSTYALAGIIGIYAIFVPSGLGVREGVITIFLSAYFPVHQAVALALLARFYATIADAGVALILLYLNRTKGKLV